MLKTITTHDFNMVKLTRIFENKDIDSYMTPLNVYVFGPNLLEDLQLHISFQSESKWKQLRLFVMSISKVDCETFNLYLYMKYTKSNVIPKPFPSKF
jgi:hypothetical protein